MNRHWQPARPDRRAQGTAFLKGLFWGLMLGLALIWLVTPVLTGQWHLL